MDQRRTCLTELLPYIDPAQLTYQEWVSVGMALKDAGYAAGLWDEWSRRDPARYRAGECARKWESFRGETGSRVTAGTIVRLARDRGWQPQLSGGQALGWDDTIGKGPAGGKTRPRGQAVEIPVAWDPVRQLITYLETLFDSTENVGYVMKSFEREGRLMPTKGCWDRTAGQLIAQLRRCNGDIGSVLGDYDPRAGAWIRINPLDGKGVRNANVADLRYALLESDRTGIDRQNAVIRALELPVACLVYSGGKSLHAVVRIDAGDEEEYRRRVDYLYAVCGKNGLEADLQNRNPSRLSRMPGVVRGEAKQYLLATNIGKRNWDEWAQWIGDSGDGLPDPESVAAVWNDLPPLAPPLIEGVLRQGHKLLLAGPSKAGKSYALIELCCAIAEGRQWLGFSCTQGRVLYVNLELDRASCLHRFKDVYTALKWQPRGLANIDIWNLRGKSVPMDKLAPKLIRRAEKKNYIAVVIDPIYKVITGDENSADQIAYFCNQFDKVCTQLGCAVIYCHHHSKGGQGGKKSMDRASGSGVFARDPDALLDLIGLEVPQELCRQTGDAAAQDGAGCTQPLTAWRVEATLREFARFRPIDLWFSYPVHLVDEAGVLRDVEPDGERLPWQRAMSRRKPPETRKKDRRESVETAFGACTDGGEVTVDALARYMGVTQKTVRNRVKEHGGFWIEEGKVGKKA